MKLGQSLFGIPVYVYPSLDNWPKFQLSPEFAAMMPADWVAEQNQWCREFFGTESKAMIVNRAVLVGPKGMQALRARTATEGSKNGTEGE